MKKSVLILLTLVPVIVGYLVNVLIMVPIIGMAGFYLLPLCTTAFWIYLGKQYAREWKTLPAILIAHIVGFCSLTVYLWQFLLETDETRNIYESFQLGHVYFTNAEFDSAIQKIIQVSNEIQISYLLESIEQETLKRK